MPKDLRYCQGIVQSQQRGRLDDASFQSSSLYCLLVLLLDRMWSSLPPVFVDAVLHLDDRQVPNLQG